MRPLLILLFAASGFAGLVYESVWAQYLRMLVGAAAYAQSLVLAVFMGGTALGAWWASRRSAEWRNLLRTYALVEVGLGLLALAFHPVFLGTRGLLLETVLPTLGPGPAAGLVTASAAVLLVLPAAVLLGMTFPLMTAALVRRQPARSGEAVAILYFANALGGTLGILTSGFLLVNLFGLPGTVVAGGLVNLIVGLAAWRLSAGAPEPTPAITHPDGGTGKTRPPTGIQGAGEKPEVTGRRTVILLTVGAVTGLASLAYEIVWVRMLSMLLSSSSHAFELMVAAFVLGLALGGLWIRRRIDHLADPAHFLAGVQVAMGVLAIGTLLVYGPLFPIMEDLLAALPSTDVGYAVFSLASYAMALVVMLPATFCAGMTLPLVTHLLLRDGGGEGRIGQVYGLNAAGSVLGALLALHLGFPLLGLKSTLAAAASLDVGLGLLLFWGVCGRSPKDWSLGALLPATLAGVLVVAFVGIDPSVAASGIYRRNIALDATRTVIDYRDGPAASISLVEEAGVLSIRTNGKPSASVSLDPAVPPTGDETVTTLLGALPLLLHPGATDGANIGLGSGITSSVLLTSPTLERLTTVEIDPAMVDLATGFGDRNRPVFDDPRSTIAVGDGRLFLATIPGNLDYIVAQPSNPWVSGSGALFSREFYRVAASKLEPGGLLVQWIQAFETESALVASIFAALAEEFPIYDVYAATGGDLIVVAATGSRIPEVTASAWERAGPGLIAALDRAEIRTLQDIAIRKAGNQHTFGLLPGVFGTDANSDFRPVIEENAARARFKGEAAVELLRLMVQPLPVLEFLGVTSPSWTSSDVTLSPNFFYSSRAVTATHFRDLLFVADSSEEAPGPGADAMSPADSVLIDQAERLAHACLTPRTPSEAFDELYGIGLAVITDLRPQELESVWSALATLPCVTLLDQVGRGWLSLLRAVGSRDAPTVAALAPSLLDRNPEAGPPGLRYAVGAGMVANLQLGRLDAARALFEEHRGRMFPGEEVSFFFRHLVALAND